MPLSCASTNQCSPSSSSSTRGAWSFHLAGACEDHRSGGQYVRSMWLSPEIRRSSMARSFGALASVGGSSADRVSEVRARLRVAARARGTQEGAPSLGDRVWQGDGKPYPHLGSSRPGGPFAAPDPPPPCHLSA